MMMKKRVLFAGLVALLFAMLFLPRAAHAFCGFYVSGADAKLVNDATQVVLMRGGNRTALSMQNDYKGPPEDFALVVPVPVVLQKENVKILSLDAFKRLDTLTSPRLVEYWERDPCEFSIGTLGHGAGTGTGQGFGNGHGRLGGGSQSVVVEAQFEVGEYEIVILSAKDSLGLDTWLRENKYKIPENAEPALAPYVQAGSKFFVAKVNAAKVKFVDGHVALSPIRFHYDSDKFELPVKLGLLNSAGTQDLIVHVLGTERYAVANYPNVTIPTNFDVSENARASFGSFYASLYDRTREKNPGSVITEYAWGAQSCDPCPGGVQGLNAVDFSSFGGDVITTIGAVGAPTLSQQPVTVSGKLPVEVIQRIVRQNFGRFRLCYENGIAKKANLQGRVAVKFSIDGKGTVTNPQDEHSDLADPDVVSCVVHAMEKLSFPEPEDHKPVTVVYPIAFSPGAIGPVSNLSKLIVTRLHARYTKSSLGNDLVFKVADGIVGGREFMNDKGELEHGATPSHGSSSAFQARYAIRHPWQGKISCDHPVRNQWGGPWPDGGIPDQDAKVQSATNLAFVSRNASLASFTTTTGAALDGALVNPDGGVLVAPAASSSSSISADASVNDGGAAVAAPSSSKCGCWAPGSSQRDSVLWPVALAIGLAFIARRKK